MGRIDLTPDEQALWEQIYFEPRSSRIDHDKLQSSIEPAYQLARSLLEREAIPPIRLRYFTDPELNIGGRGKSRKEVFERNGTSGDAILKHPHFHKYLRYFVIGPDLPLDAIAEFVTLVRECIPVSSGDTKAFCSLARQQVRNAGLNRKDAAEEYFKLGLELEIGEDIAHAVRDSIMRMSKKLAGKYL
jgi:hypothetical protein